MVLLEEDVRTGKVPNFHFTPQSPTCCSNYLTMLKGSVRQSSPRIIKWVKLAPAPQRLLDVAGEPAEHSIAFCQQYPNLKADILDLPYAAREGKARIEQAGLSDRIHYIEGNLLEEDWGTDYDVVFLSNILHCLTAEQCEIALKKAFAALGKGGKIIINDLFHPGTKGRLTSIVIVSIFSLIYYVTCGGRTWAKLTVAEWLEKTGFTNIRSAQQRLALAASAEKP